MPYTTDSHNITILIVIGYIESVMGQKKIQDFCKINCMEFQFKSYMIAKRLKANTQHPYKIHHTKEFCKMLIAFVEFFCWGNEEKDELMLAIVWC